MAAVLFIDANQYLNLYGMIAGRKLLDSVDELKSHIFVSSQIVNEVFRNKLQCAQTFFNTKLKEVDGIDMSVPDPRPTLITCGVSSE